MSSLSLLLLSANELLLLTILFFFISGTRLRLGTRLSRLEIRFEKANEPNGLSYIKSPEWMRYKNAIINQKVLMIDDFSMTLCLRSNNHRKDEILNHLFFYILGRA